MTFWYFFSGVGNATLIFRVSDYDMEESVSVWSLNGSSGRKWQFGSFAFYINKIHHVTIIALGDGKEGSVALDDIIFKESQFCGTYPPEAATETSLPLPTTTARPSTTKNPSPNLDFDCDFEYNFCNWSPDLSKPLNWTRKQGKSLIAGPKVDHTYGTADGWFALLGNSQKILIHNYNNGLVTVTLINVYFE